MCSLKDYGKDTGLILRGMKKAVEDFMHWSKTRAKSDLYSKTFMWLLYGIVLVGEQEWEQRD